MPAVSPRVSKSDVEAFCGFCVSLRSIFRHFQILFEEGADLRRALLQDIAPTFFCDLNRVLIKHLALQICKITDREESFGRKNLTVQFCINNSDFSSAQGELEKLGRLGKSMHDFRSKIVAARNRLVSHLDRSSVLDGKALGGAEKSEWSQFWLDLQDFLYILHKHYIDQHGHFYLNGVGHLSDADTLVKALKESTYFQILLDDKTLAQKCADIAWTSRYSQA
jgi:HEPN superfamily AbiU2-like protein